MTIDYAKMKAVRPGQKRALTMAVKTGDWRQIAVVCRSAVKEWDAIGCWPDDWNRWQIALNDALPWDQTIDLERLR